MILKQLEMRVVALSKKLTVLNARFSKINSCHVKSGPNGGQFCATGSKGGGGGNKAVGGVDPRVTTALKPHNFVDSGKTTDGSTIYRSKRKGIPSMYATEVVVSPKGSWEYRSGGTTVLTGKNAASLLDFLATRTKPRG